MAVCVTDPGLELPATGIGFTRAAIARQEPGASRPPQRQVRVKLHWQQLTMS